MPAIKSTLPQDRRIGQAWPCAQPGSGANAKYTNGVAVFTMDEAGLMYEASIGGQKFSYQAQ